MKKQSGRKEGAEMPKIVKSQLAPMREIYAFAMVWRQMFKNYKQALFNYFEEPVFIGNDMLRLGVDMDCGKSLEEKFPGATLGLRGRKWDAILKRIDIQTLGNAIHSQWRYYNHWHEGPMRDEDFKWFEASFARLAELAEEDERNGWEEAARACPPDVADQEFAAFDKLETDFDSREWTWPGNP